MAEPKPLASLSPTLLARKGGARPAMRPQLTPLTAETIAQPHDDLGWNDMGHDHAHFTAHPEPLGLAEVIAIEPDAPLPAPEVPVVVHQQREVARRVAQPRKSALDNGRRAAFTLRVDADRHLKLRLACALRNRSAQQLVTDALDRLLNELTDVSALAAQVTSKRTR